MRAKGWLGGGGGDRNNDDPECTVAQAKNIKGRRVVGGRLGSTTMQRAEAEPVKIRGKHKREEDRLQYKRLGAKGAGGGDKQGEVQENTEEEEQQEEDKEMRRGKGSRPTKS